MGTPKKLRKKYDKPTLMWDRQRIEEQHKLIENYGLRNLKEVWIAESELRRIRQNVREVLSGRASEQVGKEIITRLARYSIVGTNATLDDLLIIDLDSILKRRLQTIVVSKGLAKSMGQSRQLITHGFISINGRRVKSPGYMVAASDESKIGFYKPINLSSPQPVAPKQEAMKTEGGEKQVEVKKE